MQFCARRRPNRKIELRMQFRARWCQNDEIALEQRNTECDSASASAGWARWCQNDGKRALLANLGVAAPEPRN
eukprot:806248-Pyramimonas_sp.AAC.1